MTIHILDIVNFIAVCGAFAFVSCILFMFCCWNDSGPTTDWQTRTFWILEIIAGVLYFGTIYGNIHWAL